MVRLITRRPLKAAIETTEWRNLSPGRYELWWRPSNDASRRPASLGQVEVETGQTASFEVGSAFESRSASQSEQNPSLTLALRVPDGYETEELTLRRWTNEGLIDSLLLARDNE